MKVLVVKLTSMGDVIHLMPALSELNANVAELRVDWMVEDSFLEIPSWHASVDRVVPVSTRRWRSLSRRNIREFIDFVKLVRKRRYDVVIDAQGLLKSALLARFARLNKGGRRIGFSARSIKESPAAYFYQQRVEVPREQHAILRLRQLFAAGFAYSLAENEPDYALNVQSNESVDRNNNDNSKSIVFLHGTTWPSKHLPVQLWHELADLVTRDGYRVLLFWGNEAERTRAEEIAKGRPDVQVLPKMGMMELAQTLQQVSGALAVDTGLGHMAAAFNLPTVSLYGSTDARLTGARGEAQTLVQMPYHCSPCLLKECNKLTDEESEPPCYRAVRPEDIWQSLLQKIS